MAKVTVLMPVHNGSRFLNAAIESVLAQTLTDFELVVVDDASTDASAEIAKGYIDPRVRYVGGHGHHGLAGTLNIGLRSASGSYIARLDQDDVAHPNRLAVQAAFLDHRPDAALVGSRARLIDENGHPHGAVERPVSALGIRWLSLIENPLIHSTAMFRRDVVLGLGGYNETFALAEDVELWGRMLQASGVENLDEELIDYRQWSSSMMSTVERDPDGGRRRQLRAIMATLIERHVTAGLGGGVISAEDAYLLAGFTVGIEAEHLDRFLELFALLQQRFAVAWPEAADSADCRRTLARQYDTIAYRITPASRSAAAKVYAHALRSAPDAARYVSWPRAAASVVLGRDGREWVARLRR